MEKTKQHKAKVLVVDDEGDLSELLQIALNRDYSIEAVFEGRAALARMKEFHPDLIVTDTYLPSQDGFDLIEEIRKLSPIPIIVVSGSKLKRKMPYFQEKGIAAVMIKPFTLKDLRHKVQSALGI